MTPSEQFSDLSDSDSTNSDFRIAEEPLVVVKVTNTAMSPTIVLIAKYKPSFRR